MKQDLIAFAHTVDALCSRLNAGLTAVAVLLGFVVATVSIVRVAEILPDLPAAMPADFQMLVAE